MVFLKCQKFYKGKELNTIYELKNGKSAEKVILEIKTSVKNKPLEKVSGYVEVFKNKELQEKGENGIPVAIKNNINVEGWEIDCSSRIMEGYISPYNAKVVDNLLDNGFMAFGTTNMDEFAMGSTTQTSCHGVTVNPINKFHVPGGSSGGSAAVVAAGVAVAALGSDTGGSVRQPAAFCGVVGFKPAYGHVSRRGLIAYSSSLDQIGTITQDVRDYAAEHGLEGKSAIEEGMKEMAETYTKKGSKLYLEPKDLK